MGISYVIGRWIGAHKRLALALVIGVPIVIGLTNHQLRPDPVAEQAARIEAAKVVCRTNGAALLAQARQAVADGKEAQALAILAPCSQGNFSPEFVALLKTAEDAVALQNTKAAAVAAMLTAQQEKADAIQAKADDIKFAAVMKGVKARKKKEGVTIGMSAQDVLDSSWGRPDSVNTTTTADGSREQWVYRRYSHGYLYFSHGILITIQN